jgi:hypothetical protein
MPATYNPAQAMAYNELFQFSLDDSIVPALPPLDGGVPIAAPIEDRTTAAATAVLLIWNEQPAQQDFVPILLNHPSIVESFPSTIDQEWEIREGSYPHKALLLSKAIHIHHSGEQSTATSIMYKRVKDSLQYSFTKSISPELVRSPSPLAE